MKLNVSERFAALKILPKETDFVTLKIVRQLQDELALSEKELKEFEVETVQQGQYIQTKWNEKGNKEVEIKIGEKATDVIIDALKELDKQKKLTTEHLTLYEKFVEKA